MEEIEEHLAESECDHDEVDAPRAQRERSDDRRDHRNREKRHRQREPERGASALGCHEAEHVARKPEKSGVAQADKAAIADDEVERERHHAHQHRLARELDIVVRRKERQGRGGDQDERDKPAQHGRMKPDHLSSPFPSGHWDARAGCPPSAHR